MQEYTIMKWALQLAVSSCPAICVLVLAQRFVLSTSL